MSIMMEIKNKTLAKKIKTYWNYTVQKLELSYGISKMTLWLSEWLWDAKPKRKVI